MKQTEGFSELRRSAILRSMEPASDRSRSPRSAPDPALAEPSAAAALAPFEEGDFHVLGEGLSRDRQYDERRLALRRKLLGLGRVFAARAKTAGLELDVRTSLHHPHAFNHMRVRRMWTYTTRPKKERTRLGRVLGPELAKDLDAAYRNAYLCVALEESFLEVSLRIHADAWYDGQNLTRRVAAEGVDGWKALLNELDGWRLGLADWKGEWPLGKLPRERLEEFLRFWEPGTHALVVERRWPATPGLRAALCAPEVPALVVEELTRLIPLYRFSAWSKESDFLFAG